MVSADSLELGVFGLRNLLSTCLPIYLSTYIPAYLSRCLSVYRSVFIYLFVFRLWLYLFLCPPIYLF